MTTSLPFQGEQPIFGKMGGISELSHMGQEERRRYMNSLNNYRSNRAAWAYVGVEEREEGRKAGLEEGRKEGLEEGRKEGRIEIARNAKAMGLDSSSISQLTGLTIEEIGRL